MSRMGQLAQNRLAAAIVLHDDCVLLVRRSFTERFLPGVWGIPCGKLAPEEDPETGALRELKEETGIVGEVCRRAGRSSFISEWDGQTVYNEQVNYLVRPLSFEVVLPEPDQEFRWVPIRELGDVDDLDSHNVNAIKQAL